MFSFRAISASINRLIRSANQSLRAIFRPVQRVTRYSALAALNWGRTRNWIYFLQALPAIAMILAVIVLVTLRWSISATELESRYYEIGKTAFASKNFPLTKLSHERVASMGKDRPESLYEMAAALFEMGDRDRALNIMKQLAPNDRTGHGRAHLWMAMYLWKDLNHRDPEVRNQAKALIEKHLERTLYPRITDDDISNAMLGQLYMKYGELAKAEVHLARATEKKPVYRLDYARVLAAQKKTDKAREEAEKASNFFEDRATRDFNDKRSRMVWAESQVFLENFPAAIKILYDGYLDKKDPDYRAGLASVYHAAQNHVAQKDPKNIATQLDLLEKGLQYDPTNAPMLNTLMSFVWKKDDAKAGTEARQILDKAIAEKGSPAGHFLKGMDAWQRDDHKTAQFHWEAALELDPNLVTVANNLAWLLAFRNPPELDKALKLINQVVQQAPHEMTFLDTRGKIYMKMASDDDKKSKSDYWKAAQRDFDTVSRRAPNFPNVHANLAIVYDRLELPTIAQEHRQLQEEIDKKQKKSAPK